jgi:hypothetical protein
MFRARIRGNDIVVGGFYETSDGRIARVSGWNGSTRKARYEFDDDAGDHEIDEEAFGAWIRREDLADFPNARDPVLPYIFDLIWDVKTRSRLVRLLSGGEHDGDLPEIMRIMEENSIVLTAAEQTQVDEARSRGIGGPDF